MSKKVMIALFILVSSLQGWSQVKKEPFENGVYIVDGDIALYSEQDVEKYHTSIREQSKELIINLLASSAYDLWNMKGGITISYCISDEFTENKSLVISALQDATESWMEYGNFQFQYIPEQDFNCNQENELVMFDVRPVKLGWYLARAFFPSTPRDKRNILIDNSSFKYPYRSFVGILKHELGHVLGFRHEHIHSDNSGRCDEDDDFRPLTSYDRNSVMHYPQCGGNKTIRDLDLSEMDKEGVALVYPKKG